MRGNAPRSAPYQEAGLLLTYTPSETWSGQRVPPPRSPRWQRGVLLARLWPRMVLAARAGVEPAACCFKDSSPYRYRVPGRIKLGAGEWNRTTKVLRRRIYSPLSPPPARRRHGGADRNRTGISRLQGGCSPVERRPPNSWWTQADLPRHLPIANRVLYWLSDGPINGLGGLTGTRTPIFRMPS